MSRCQGAAPASHLDVTWYNLGLCRYYLGEWEAAINAFASTLALNEHHGKAAEYLGLAEGEFYGLMHDRYIQRAVDET